MRVNEPVTLLTDCLLAALAGWLAARLWSATTRGNLAGRWWSYALVLTALSAFVGGLYHGFGPHFPTIAKPWWILTLWLLCLTSAAMGLSLCHEIFPAGRGAGWRMLIALKLAVFAVAVVVRPKFVVAILDYGLILIAWGAAACGLPRGWRGWMLAAIVACVAGALVQQLAWGLSPGFNHNDLYHVIQGLALYGFYRAARQFGSTEPAQSGK